MKVIKPTEFQDTTGNFIDGGFTRASTATYYNKLGVLSTAAINEPRLTFNPVTLSYEGMLVEYAGTNVLRYSAQFDNAAWIKTESSVSANTVTAPDGTLTADVLIESTNTAIHLLEQFNSLSGPLDYAGSVYFKIGTRSVVELGFSRSGAWTDSGLARFDLSTGTVISNANGKAKITPVGNGWYRCTVTGTKTATTENAYLRMSLINSAGSNNYLGDGVSGLYIWGAQVEANTKATSYIPTVASAVTREADVVTGSGLIQSTVTDANSLYSSGSTYANAVTVRYSGNLYLSIQSSNTNHQPDTSPTWWTLIGPDNIHSAFDTSVSTVSSATTEMTFTIKAGVIDSVALINLSALISEIAVTDIGSGLVYSSKAGLNSTEVFDWYQYFFYDPLIQRTQVIFTGLPPYINALISVRLVNADATTVSVAQAVFGSITTIGKTQYGADAGIVNYSIKQTDEFGKTTFVERAYSKRLSAQVHLENTQVNRAQNYLYSIRAKPSVWIGSDDPKYEEVLIIYGYYKEFSLNIAYPSHSVYSLDIEGLA